MSKEVAKQDQQLYKIVVNRHGTTVGRPSKYRPEHCQKVIDAAKSGYSLMATAGYIGIPMGTFQQWREDHPEFAAACKLHQVFRTLWLETGVMDPNISGPMVAPRLLALKNTAPEEWRERTETTNTSNINIKSVTMDMTLQEAADAYARAVRGETE